MGRQMRILFANKMVDGTYTIYGTLVPPSAIESYKEKIAHNVDNKLCFATGIQFGLPSKEVVYNLIGTEEKDGRFFTVIKFEDTESANKIYNSIINNHRTNVNLINIGWINTVEMFNDKYLAISMKLSFFKFLRKKIKFIDNYYKNQAFYIISNK